VPHQEAALRPALPIEAEGAHLPVHLGQGLPVVAHVRLGPGQTLSRLITAVFGVRQIDVDHPVQQGEGLEGLVPVGIVDQGEAKPERHGRVERLEDLRHHMGGGDEVDVGAPFLLQADHGLCQLVRAERVRRGGPADLVILAESAPKRAAREKDRSAAAARHKGRLLAEVGQSHGHPGPCTGTAGPHLPGEPIHSAAMRAERTGPQALAGL